MTDLCECDEHGSAVATIVCMHILDTLEDGRSRGFLWSVDEDGEFQAVCSECDAMSKKLWEQRATELGRVLCFECYCRAADCNGVSRDELSQ